jgi:glyceraldehyde-3-phosphate dehydrogenase/erythrose-4-phosphate dehydrogenase
MKAEEAKRNVNDYLLKQKELRIVEIEERIKSGMYDSIFHQIKLESTKGRYSTRVNVHDVFLYLETDFEHLGYKVKYLQNPNPLTYKCFEIRWSTR